LQIQTPNTDDIQIEPIGDIDTEILDGEIQESETKLS